MFVRTWLFGPNFPRITNSSLITAGIEFSILNYAVFLQTAHRLDSGAANFLTADDNFTAFLDCVNHYEEIIYRDRETNPITNLSDG